MTAVQEFVTLLADLEAPADGRRFVRQACQAAQLSEAICDVAVLLTSELVTNAVVHGRSDA